MTTTKIKISNSFIKLNLKAKATIIAVLIGTVPIAVIGVAAYFGASNTIRQTVADNQKKQASEILNKLNRFMFERYGDVQVIANLPILKNPKVRAVVNEGEKNDILTKFTESYAVYSNIAVYDLNGNLVLSGGKEKAIANVSDRDYFQEPLKTGKPFISGSQISKVTGQPSFFFSAPVIDGGKIIYIARSRMPTDALDEVIREFGSSQDQYHIFDQTGKIFLATEKDQVGKNGFQDIPNLQAAYKRNITSSFLTLDSSRGGAIEQVAGFASAEKFQNMPKLNWSNAYLTDTKYAFKAETDIGRTIAIGTILVAILVAFLAVWLANQLTKPIAEAVEAVNKIGKGDLSARLNIVGDDELAVLGQDINSMAQQIQELLAMQAAETEMIELARQEARQDADAATQEQRGQKEFLQKRALELLIEVDPISQGDLTVRAKVTEDEIGTIADSYNSTVGNLRRIVTQVQTAAKQMADTTSSSESSVQDLSTEALRQSEEITGVLDRIQEMSSSIRLVATNAGAAETMAQQAGITVKAGDAAMNRTVDGILAIRSTVAETSKKVKRLGESSQKISKVVNLISSFADQTNLLALNAAIEAARAGEEGRGFAVVADQVRSLARQSAAASAEIESLVAEIQTETNEVVTAMETGTEQVVAGTKLVEEARQNLTQIAEASAQINILVEAISKAAAVQSIASDAVTETMTDVAAIALSTSTGANQVSNSFKDLLEVAQQLQKSVGQFKVN